MDFPVLHPALATVPENPIRPHFRRVNRADEGGTQSGGDLASVMDEDILDRLAEEEKEMVVRVAKRYTGANERKINALIKEFVAKLAVCNRAYIKVCMAEWGYQDYPFLHKEREIYSLMSAAMYQITPVLQSESRVTKKRDRRNPINRGMEQEGSGRVDLWAYKDGIEYFFEFKRSYVALSTVRDGNNPPNLVSIPWNELDQQVKQVKAGLENGESTCCIGLQVITPYRSKQGNEPFSPEKLTRREIEGWIGRIRPIPDAALWYIQEEELSLMPTRWDGEDEDEIVRWEFHPCHLFLFRIFSA